MDKQLTTLLALFNQLVQLHAALLAEAELKRTAIIEGDIVGMENILERENALIMGVESAEVTRSTLMEELAADLKVTKRPLTVSMLLERLPRSPDTLSLAQAKDKLKSVLEKLRFRSRQNEELLKASIEHVKGFLKMISEASTVNKTYNHKGTTGRGNLRLLDRTA